MTAVRIRNRPVPPPDAIIAAGLLSLERQRLYAAIQVFLSAHVPGREDLVSAGK